MVYINGLTLIVCSLLDLVRTSNESCVRILNMKEQLNCALCEASQWSLQDIPSYVRPSEKLMGYVYSLI